MKNNNSFVEAGPHIINLDLVAYLKKDGETLRVGFAGCSECITLQGEMAKRFEVLFRSKRTVSK